MLFRRRKSGHDLIDEMARRTLIEADLTRTPEYVVENDVKDFTQLALHGVKLGGDAAEIPADKIKETADSGWAFTSFVHCTDGTTFKVISGMVVEFFFPGVLFAERGLGTEADVVRRLGKPNRIRQAKTGPVPIMKHLTYKKKHLIFDITADGEVARVIVYGK